MKEQEFIQDKISTLMKEGYSKSQSAAIAYNMWKKEGVHKAQEGVNWNPNMFVMPDMDNMVKSQMYTPQQDFSNTVYPTQTPVTTPTPLQLSARKELESFKAPIIPRQADITNSPVEEQKPTEKKQYGFNNLFSGVSLEDSLFTLGQGLGEKDPYKTAVGGGLSLLKIGRTGMSGYATGKRDKEIYNDMYDKLYSDQRVSKMLQEGGDINIAELLTGKYLVDNPNGGNIELENKEFVKHNQTGQVQEVVGDSHKDGGVKAELSDAKVLSDYTKIGAKNAKELKDRYEISLRATDTFAKAMDKVNKKLGVYKTTEELSKYIEKLGDNSKVKDKTTRSINEKNIAKEIEEYKSKLDTLSGAQESVFEDIFARQEEKGKIGDGSQILNGEGKPMKEGGITEDFSVLKGSKIVSYTLNSDNTYTVYYE